MGRVLGEKGDCTGIELWNADISVRTLIIGVEVREGLESTGNVTESLIERFCRIRVKWRRVFGNLLENEYLITGLKKENDFWY